MNELTARDIMQASVRVVTPDMTLPDLERLFISEKVGGFPVVEEDRLVGIVSRSDIVRQLCVERTVAQETSDFYYDESGFHELPLETLDQVAGRIGERIEGMKVKDVMVRDVRTVAAEQTLSIVAQTMVDHRIHRLPVVHEGKLVGIITTIDLVRLIADRRLSAG